MMYSPVRTEPPDDNPLTLAQAKAHLRVDVTDDDDLIEALLEAAVTAIDGWTGTLGRCLMPQTWRQDYNIFSRHMRLPLFPVASVVTVGYDDTARVARTIAGTNYQLLNDECGAYIRFNNAFPIPGVSNEYPSVHITYEAGYEDADAVPQAIKQAMLLMIGHWYANRESVVVDSRAAAINVPFTVDALLAPYRRVKL